MLTKTDPVSIGNRIRNSREKLNMTREAISEQIGITPYFLGQIERGERSMSVKTLIKISAAVNESLDYLVYGVHFNR